ncbi:MAG: MBG domain-containing protein [Mediterraneibacter faecis]
MKNAKRCLAILLAVTLLCSNGVSQLGTIVSASELETTEEAQPKEDAVVEQAEETKEDTGKATVEGVTPEEERGESSAQDAETANVPKAAAQEGQNEANVPEAAPATVAPTTVAPTTATPATVTPATAVPAAEGAGQAEEATAPEVQTYNVKINKSELDGGQIKVWGSDNTQVDVTEYDGNNQYVKEVKEGEEFNFQITLNDGFEIAQVKVNGNAFDPAKTEGNVITYKVAGINEEKVIDVTYNKIETPAEEKAAEEPKTEDETKVEEPAVAEPEDNSISTASLNENISTVADSEKTIKVGETASLKSSDYKSRKYSHIWSITSGNDVIKLTGSGYKVTAEGLKEGTATVSDWIYRYSLYHTTITYTVRVTSSEKVTVKPAIVYYLKDPTKDANSNDTGHWGDAYGNATVNVEGAKWVNDKNCFNGLSQRVVSWPNNTNVIPKNSTHWNAIFNEYKASIQTQLGGVKITADDVEEITLVPAKISKNNGTDPDLHLDCNVNIKCKSVALVKYYLFDANGTNWEMLGSKNYIVKDTSTTKPGDVTSRTFPETKTVNGVTYKFSGWYTDENLTQRAPEFPAKVTGSVNYYAKYTAEYKVSYNLAGGKFSDDSTSAEEKHNADTTVTVKEEPTRAGYEFIGWTVEGLGTTTTLDSGETFTMPNRDVTLTAKWEEQKIEEFLTLVPKDVSKPYDGTELQAGTAKVTGKVEGADTASVKIEYSLNGTDWTTNPSEVTATNVSDSKTVQVRATSEKYTGELTGTEELTITPKPVTVTANSYNKTYGASDPEFTVTVVGTLGTDKVTYNLSREAGEDVGTYPITASGDAIQGNYNVTYHPGTLTITAATRPEDRQLGVTSYEGVYDANDHTITVDNVLDGDVVEYSYDGGETWTTNLNQYKDVTETTIKVRVTNANYDPSLVELEGTVKITPKPVTVTANSYNKAYGATDPTFTAKVEGTLGTDAVNYILNRETGENVGTYKILAIGDATQGNYSVTYYPGTLTITAATRPEDKQLSVTSYEGVYDANEHTITVDNVLDGDVVEYSYDGGETWTTNLNQYKDVTETTIKVRVTNANYDPSPVELEGTVKITPATLTVSTPIATKVYEGTPLTAAGTISGFVNDETATFATTGSQTEVGSTANTYSLTWDGTAKESNYKVVETIGTLTVTAQSIDPDNPNYKGITVDAPTDVEYTGEDQTWLPTVTDGNGKALVKDTDYTVTYDNEDRTNVTGIITVTINGAGNYAGTITRTYQITPKPVTITTESKTKAFDGTALTAGGKVEGIVSGETYGFKTTGSQTYVGSSQNTYEMVWADSEVEGTSGTYTAKKTNYTVTESIGTLAVTAGTPENPLDPTLVVNKTHDKSQTYKAGDVITFTITAKNIYEEAKTITLEELEGVALDANVFENVAPGAEVTATATYTVTEQDIVNGTFTNNVTVTFSGVDDKFTGTDTVDELEDANPHMTITKTTVGAEEGHIYKLGEVINYKITATNDGNLTLTNVKVEDALTGNVGENAFTIDTLAPDEAQTFDVRYVVTENDVLEGKVINNATGTATDPTDPDEPKTPVTPGEKEDPIETPNPSLAVVKTSDKTGVVKLGETITYTITVTNNGNVTINDIEVTDELTGNTGDNAFTIDRLAVGETKQFTATYTVTEDDILEGTIVNRATATGKDPRNEEVTGEGEVRVDTEEKDDSKKDDSKKNDSDKKPGAVKTGDATDVIPFFGMTVLAAGAAIVIALKKKRRA